MKRDPYQDLGVPPDADAPTIKRAYRKKAAKHHPDKGGKPEEFLAVQRAYDILSNEERRQRYDRFGDTEETDLDTEARKTLIRTVMEFVRKGHPTRDHMIKLAGGFIRSKMADQRQQIVSSRKQIRRWQEAVKRTTARGDNFMVPAFHQEIAGIEAGIKQIELSLEIGSRMLKLLADFDYTVDQPEDQDVPFKSSPFHLFHLTNPTS